MTIHSGKCTFNCDLYLQQLTNEFNMPKSAVLYWQYVKTLFSVRKTEAAGTIVYTSDHKKMRVYPVSALSRISLLNLTKLGIKLFWGLFVSPYHNEI